MVPIRGKGQNIAYNRNVTYTVPFYVIKYICDKRGNNYMNINYFDVFYTLGFFIVLVLVIAMVIRFLKKVIKL